MKIGLAFTLGPVVLAFQQMLLGAPVIYTATGKTPEDIQPMVDQFRRDIAKGGSNNVDLPGPLPGGWREISADDLAGKASFPAGFVFFPERGALWSAPPGGRLLVSLETDPTDPSRNFWNVNPSYSETFQPYKSRRLIGTEIFSGWGLGFAIPGPSFNGVNTVGINAIGAIFTDVDLIDRNLLFHAVDGSSTAVSMMDCQKP